MLNLLKRTQFSEENDTIDALLALQMLEDQEQRKEQEFFQITEEIQRFGLDGQEAENILPELLQTKRERALYEALMTLIRISQPPAQFHIQAHETGRVGMA
jgi:TnpA family transposase